ncbi:methyltransferase domain-containing protein [Candidatus Dependentiae bacterium]|nr:methyltransferase domain-containing protein [Candidatus Dependentiae bacterium]
MKKKDRQKIYIQNSADYEKLVEKEDYLNNIEKIISEITDYSNKKIIDSGCGTGRLSFILSRKASKIQGFDVIENMIETAEKKASRLNIKNCSFKIADHRNLPVESKSIDLVVSGWSICHLVKWNWKNWKNELLKAIEEFKRTLKKNGAIIILETLGTGQKHPEPPDKKLQTYYDFLEKKLNFKKNIIKTDYRFNNIEEYRDTMILFFGKDTIKKIETEKTLFFDNKKNVIIPEWTGVWNFQS